MKKNYDEWSDMQLVSRLGSVFGKAWSHQCSLEEYFEHMGNVSGGGAWTRAQDAFGPLYSDNVYRKKDPLVGYLCFNKRKPLEYFEEAVKSYAGDPFIFVDPGLRGRESVYIGVQENVPQVGHLVQTLTEDQPEHNSGIILVPDTWSKSEEEYEEAKMLVIVPALWFFRGNNDNILE